MENEKTMYYNPLEISRIIGEPKDPRKPYGYYGVIPDICEIDSALPDEYLYEFNATQETDKIYVVTSTGECTQLNITPNTPSLISYVDNVTPEFWIKLKDLASAKEKILARKKVDINRALDGYEVYSILQALNSAVQSANDYTIGSGNSSFAYDTLVQQMNGLDDYADNYVLLVSAQIQQDIRLWDWTYNKYTSLATALKDLNVKIVRVFGQVYVDGTLKNIIDPNTSYLIGTQSATGKPILFVRKQLNAMEDIGGVIKTDGTAPERWVIVGTNPQWVNASTARYLAVSLIGWGEIAIIVTNPYAISRFVRS